jgi:hypothetical protein
VDVESNVDKICDDAAGTLGHYSEDDPTAITSQAKDEASLSVFAEIKKGEHGKKHPTPIHSIVAPKPFHRTASLENCALQIVRSELRTSWCTSGPFRTCLRARVP